MSYNGWTNRETWLVNVWFDPQSREDLEGIRAHIEDEVDNLPLWIQDFCSFDRIDWDELLEHFEEEEEDA